MLVAQERGIVFTQDETGEWHTKDQRAANQALDDVGREIGYADRFSYNHDCIANPTDVKERLARL